MTIDQAKNLKSELENRVAELLIIFEKSTNISIDKVSIVINKFDNGKSFVIATKIDIEL